MFRVPYKAGLGSIIGLWSMFSGPLVLLSSSRTHCLPCAFGLHRCLRILHRRRSEYSNSYVTLNCLGHEKANTTEQMRQQEQNTHFHEEARDANKVVFDFSCWVSDAPNLAYLSPSVPHLLTLFAAAFH
jgi:hypothetical protein